MDYNPHFGCSRFRLKVDSQLCVEDAPSKTRRIQSNLERDIELSFSSSRRSHQLASRKMLANTISDLTLSEAVSRRRREHHITVNGLNGPRIDTTVFGLEGKNATRSFHIASSP